MRVMLVTYPVQVTLASDLLWHLGSREATATVGYDVSLRQARLQGKIDSAGELRQAEGQGQGQEGQKEGEGEGKEEGPRHMPRRRGGSGQGSGQETTFVVASVTPACICHSGSIEGQAR